MKRGKIVCGIVSRIMPCFIRHLNPIVHRYKTEEYNLHGNQIKVLNVVRILKSVSSAKLSIILDIQKGSLTTIIRSLVEMKLLIKKFSIADPRRYTLSITERGRLLLEEKMAEDGIKFSEIFDDMPDDDFNKVVEGFEILSKYFHDKEVDNNGN